MQWAGGRQSSAGLGKGVGSEEERQMRMGDWKSEVRPRNRQSRFDVNRSLKWLEVSKDLES